MGLDLVAFSRQIEGIGEHLRKGDGDRKARLEQAQSLVREVPLERWRELSQQRGGGRPVPCPEEPLDSKISPPKPPESFTVFGVDGSQIASDRHQFLSCHLINIGTAELHYGPVSDARLSSQPFFFYLESDRFIFDPSNADRRAPIQGAVLHAKRTVMESQRLAEIAEQHCDGSEGLLLLDNAIIFWGLVTDRFETYVRNQLLEEYSRHLDRVKQANEAGAVLPLAGYISRPGTSVVVDLLARYHCQDPTCRSECTRLGRGQRPCDRFADLLDRHLFQSLLPEPGQRSALFSSALDLLGQASEVAPKVNVAHSPWFYYLNTGDEIARVEIPAWVAQDRRRLDLTHSLVFDQIQRGSGYPVALMEANEQAFVAKADRDQFWFLLEAALQESGVPIEVSAKAWSKQWRAV